MKSTLDVSVEISDQDVKVVGLLADGLKVEEIAKKNGVNRRTLEAKIASLKIKLGCVNAANLVAFFFRNNLIT